MEEDRKTTDQNIDRQIIAVKQFAPDISDNNIFVDKKTGKRRCKCCYAKG